MKVLIKDSINIERIKETISNFKFNSNGVCDLVASNIADDLSKIGYMKSSEYDVILDIIPDTEFLSEIIGCYELKIISSNNIPHKVIDIYNTKFEYQFTIDIPYTLYEEPFYKGSELRWKCLDSYINLNKENIIFYKRGEL